MEPLTNPIFKSIADFNPQGRQSRPEENPLSVRLAAKRILPKRTQKSGFATFLKGC